MNKQEGPGKIDKWGAGNKWECTCSVGGEGDAALLIDTVQDLGSAMATSCNLSREAANLDFLKRKTF